MSIEKSEIRLLKGFYELMSDTRAIRFEIVNNIFENQSGMPNPYAGIKVAQEQINSLKNALFSLEHIPATGAQKTLLLDAAKKIDVDLTYETEELKKDIFFLENGEKKFFGYLENIHSDFLLCEVGM